MTLVIVYYQLICTFGSQVAAAQTKVGTYNQNFPAHSFQVYVVEEVITAGSDRAAVGSLKFSKSTVDVGCDIFHEHQR